MTYRRKRAPNNTGYIRQVQNASGLRYQARLRNKYLGTFTTRDEAQAAIEQARNAPPPGDEVA